MSNSVYALKIWTKEFIAIFAFHFILMGAMYSTLVTVGNYTIEKYDINPSIAGFTASIFIVGVLIGRAVTGYQINHLGARKIMVIGTSLYFLTYILYFFDFGLTFLLVTRLLNGLATGIISTALNTLATISVPEERRGEGISYFSLSMVVASAVGPFIAFLLLEVITFEMMLVYVGVLMVLVVLMIPMIKINNITKETAVKPTKFILIEKNSLRMLMPIFLMGLAYSSVLSFLNTYAIEIDVVTAASFFFIVYAVAVLSTRPFTGRLIDQKGPNMVIYPTFILMAIGFLILGNTTSGLLVLVAGFIIGLGFGNFQSAAQIICVKVAPKENVGLATSTYFIILEIGLGFGPVLLGLLIPFVGYDGMYLWLILPILIAGLCYMLFVGKRANRFQS
ncbi:MFS transporter [Jeotgalicoccus sp. ATCC 8456]|uniref:MFS transporter n=1 Tax=Jeotgalicoccus sp. ATCC 8456 TaxID=946435 RepID=UPI0018E6361F|nr:MFS transporter [Jeotgalicoccus sp. ATCC 8456]QQD84739.1 MFS transporter [Jeotgalicoccus sp. ATCC 8456]